MIDFSLLKNAVQEAVGLGLGESAEIVATLARQKAPVRRIFDDAMSRPRSKTADEMEADRSIRKSLGLSVEGSRSNPNPQIIREGGRIPPKRWKERRLSQAAEAYAARESGGTSRLTARGAYEVKTRRAVGMYAGHRTIGGQLRESITAEAVTRRGGRSVAWVIASADYAKYQEYGTAHNRAHPFLRPAAEESRSRVATTIGDWVGYAATSRASAGKVEIEVVIPIGGVV
jgi:HK97 gp10 family phage protein